MNKLSLLAVASLFCVSSVALAEKAERTGYLASNETNINLSADLHRGQVALLRVQGNGEDGASDLDCAMFVMDEDNEPIVVAKDDDNTNLCLIRLTAPATARYRIGLINHGRGQSFKLTLTTTDPS